VNMATILVVEDESIIARDIAGRLEMLGHEVSAIVGSGEEAIAQATVDPPDLVLMDIILQGTIDGIEAAERIQTDLNIPVVYLTAHADRETLRRAKFTEPFGYILKPFRDLEFDATVEMALSRFQAESRMLKDLESLEELIEIRSRYNTLVCHEFRIPLAEIQTSTTLLQQHSDRNSTTPLSAGLRQIQIALKHMRLLLRDVEEFSQTHVTLTFSPTRLDLASICHGLVNELKLGLETEAAIILTISSNIPPIFLDERLLRHILVNLLSNAIKYSPQETPIHFRVLFEGQEPDEPDANRSESSDLADEIPIAQPPTVPLPRPRVTFQVHDQGIGIPQDGQEKLFDAFYRADNVGNIPGIGMGLAIAKRCVDIHQGILTCKSELGSGTTFTVVLPTVESS
jgi:signal transduction histidine kinase